MEKAKVFKNGRSQAVRLPKEYRFDSDEVFIKRIGDNVLLMPKKPSWKTFFAALESFPEDFMKDRNQPRRAERRKQL